MNQPRLYLLHLQAGVAELADAHDSKSCILNGYVGSIPTFGTCGNIFRADYTRLHMTGLISIEPVLFCPV